MMVWPTQAGLFPTETSRSPMLVVNERLSIPLREFHFGFARSSGPGGQNVNKVNSKAILRWAVATSPSLPEDIRQRLLTLYCRRVSGAGTLLITSQRFRDAGRNVADCLEKLRRILAEVSESNPPRRPTVPTRGSVRRRLENKRAQSKKKQLRGDRSMD
jgi:ribosome-associated protein